LKAEGFSCILDVLRGGLGINAVLRSRDVYFRSRILIFIHPGSLISDPEFRVKKAPDPGSWINEFQFSI
jgi:hypothetical protein